MFALGYAGWGPGQIESEIRANGWIHCDADASILFGPEMETKWNRALGKRRDQCLQPVSLTPVAPDSRRTAPPLLPIVLRDEFQHFIGTPAAR